MHVVFVDCYDSFTWNLVQVCQLLGAQVQVVRCDETSPAAILQLRPQRVILGPGPGRPEDAGCLVDCVREIAGRIPILGVCLGHQAIGLAYGGRVVRHDVVHGHATPIHHDGKGLFKRVPAATPMTRYHSLVVEAATLPDCLRATAWSDDGAIMGVTHREFPIDGVQFHPESVLSGEPGIGLIGTFLRWTRPTFHPEVANVTRLMTKRRRRSFA